MMESMVCCPLSGNNDYEGRPKHFEASTPVAGKSLRCCECREAIRKGDRYERHSGIWFDHKQVYRTCMSCVEIRDHFACDGWIYESLWEDLENNFFPDMKAGGVCMEGLSPSAKQRLVDARMIWYFAQDEVDDGVWEDWATRRPTP